MTSRVFAGAVIGTAALFAAVLVPEPAYSHKPITTNILFKNEIAQIFQRKCFQCHSDNNLAMSLTTYAEARPWARAIREEVLERTMPPWQAVPGYGHFTNDLSLNTREKEIILSWTDGGAPSGGLRAEETIPPVFVPDAPSWDHGEPDLVSPIGTGQLVASGSAFEVKRFVVQTKLASPKRIKAMALKQGDRRVVRHAAFYDKSGRFIGAWTPWQTVSEFAGDVAVELPANAEVSVEIGYRGADVDVTDKGELGFYFAEGEGAVAGGLNIEAPQQSLPARAEDVRTRTEMKLSENTRLLAFWPNPGVGARSIELAVVAPDGMSTPLLWINDYRPEWRAPYLLASPVDVPRGSRLVMTAYFDNQSEQPLVVQAQTWVVTATSRRAAAPRK